MSNTTIQIIDAIDLRPGNVVSTLSDGTGNRLIVTRTSVRDVTIAVEFWNPQTDHYMELLLDNDDRIALVRPVAQRSDVKFY